MNSWRQVAADRPGLGLHRDRLQPHALEGAHIGQHHLAIADHRAVVVQVEGIRVLHQELAPAHHAEARAHLVAELPLDVVEDLRQLAVALHRLAEQVGDHLLVGRAVQHLALVPVDDAQHLLAVVVVAPALAPQLGRLDGRHQHFLRAGGVLLLAHDAFDVLQHPEADRQPGIDAGGGLPHQPGAQHQPVRGDLRLGGRFLQRGHETVGEAHRDLVRPQAFIGRRTPSVRPDNLAGRAGGSVWRRVRRPPATMALHRGGASVFPAAKIPRRPATARLSRRTLTGGDAASQMARDGLVHTAL